MLSRTLLLVSAILATLLVGTLSAEPPAASLQKLHTQEAESYRIYRDEAHTQPLELRLKPVFNWTNLAGADSQYGHLFVWTFAGRPEAIGTIFSTRAADTKKRKLIHEFHTLSSQRLYPVTPETSSYRWEPKTGIVLTPAEEAPAVAGSATQRLQQMRSLARSFAAESWAQDGKTWELRLLTTPLLQYQPASGEVLEGALFAMVSSAGTDPEVLLLIEARHPADDPKSWTWCTAALRFSDRDLTIKRNDRLVWSSRDDQEHRAEIKNQYTLIETRDKTYMCYLARVLDELPRAEP